MNKTLFNILLFFRLLSTCCYAAYAQNGCGLPAVVNYTKFDYHGGSQNWGIGQDKHGVMYFANNDGLLSYDGSHWKLYPLPNSTVIWSLAVSDDGKIYVGGQDEIGYFAPGSNGVLTYTSLKNNIPEQHKKFADIWHIAIMGSRVFFQGDDRIFEYNGKSIRVHLSNAQWFFMARAGDHIYAVDRVAGLLQFDNNQWAPVPDGKKIAGMLTAGIVSMGKDSVFIVSRTNGIFLLHNNSISLQPNNLPGHLYINGAAKVNDAELMVASSAGGALVVDIRNKTWQTFSNDQGLQNNNALSVFKDASGNLWTGLNSGISYINYNSAIRYLQVGKTNNLPGYSASIFNNRLYVATSNGLYSALLTDNKNIHVTQDDFALVKNTDNREAWNLAVINGHLLLGSDNGSYDVQGNEARLLSGDAGSWYFLPLSSVFPVQDIIVGTYYGLKRLRYEDNHFSDEGKIEGTPDSYRFMALDSNGDIWASHPYRGIYRVSLSQDKKKYAFHLYTSNDGLPSTLNNFVFKIKNQVLFATSGGLYEFNTSTNKFFLSRFLSSVFGRMKIRYLMEDKEGNIWFCGEKGTGVVHFSSTDTTRAPQVTYFPELAGQLLPKFENIYAYNPENVFIGSEKGLIHLNYQRYTSAKQPVAVRLGMVKTTSKSDSTIFGGYQDAYLAASASGSGKHLLELPSAYNAFHFEYSSPVYDFQQSITYSYQLEGYDPDWSSWDSKTEKDYTNLPNGKYTFRVKARDYQHNESTVVSYSFIIKAPWYKTIWAMLCYMAIAAGLVLLVRKYLKHKLLIQQQKFEDEQKKLKYIHHLELEKNEKEIIKLQNEKLAQEVLLKKKELANTSMHLMEKADTLTKIKEKVSRLNTDANPDNNIKSITDLIKDAEKINANWDVFAAHFDELNDDFLNKLKKQYPQLTNSDLKVCAYIKLNLSTKEIAQLLNITVRGVEVSRYRIRKKMNLPTEQSLSTFFNQI
ncbi:ligand-binding sensor domain-containing protein [Chitinophaga polysaccharea]|uniref:Ligand-binding sensor domain-containing protein n=1 Tax=Chitinophaga polysaccharea TaxID=1293035 RepID=A0A561PUM6_9BACT|nr:triple tyrosine motif-containing protein [Chitinophaga polysaccharea]TWF41800.1 ligand-binding sensor domain-containing protein [Chitinophaga polysaccharea]